jgi:5-methylcytosine-specific restriction endonuclease McrA
MIEPDGLGSAKSTLLKCCSSVSEIKAIIDELSRIEWEPLVEESEIRKEDNLLVCTLCNRLYEKPSYVSPKNEGRCYQCDCKYGYEQMRVSSHISRATKNKVVATLTVDEWMDTIDYFRWQCAYCESGPFETLDHYIPMILGGGTTKNNCVPACAPCNRRKNATPPNDVSFLSPAKLTYIKNYLHQF